MLCRLNQVKCIASAAIDRLLGIVRDSAFWGLCRDRHRPQSREDWGLAKLNAKMMNASELMITSGQSP